MIWDDLQQNCNRSAPASSYIPGTLQQATCLAAEQPSPHHRSCCYPAPLPLLHCHCCCWGCCLSCCQMQWLQQLPGTAAALDLASIAAVQPVCDAAAAEGEKHQRVTLSKAKHSERKDTGNCVRKPRVCRLHNNLPQHSNILQASLYSRSCFAHLC
jgi:hypothetical protein